MRSASLVVALTLGAASCGSNGQPAAESASTSTVAMTAETEPGERGPTATPTTATTADAASVESTAPVTTPTTTTVPEETSDGCRRLSDFDDDTDRWFIVNDGVMGGQSNGAVEFINGVMRFSGTVVTDGGGFTSLRFRTDDGELAGTGRLELRVRGDGRNYGLTLGDAGRVSGRDVSHRASMTLTNPGEWETVSVAYADLEQTIFGRDVDAESFDPETAEEVGIIIADGIDGEFTLDIESIDACS